MEYMYGGDFAQVLTSLGRLSLNTAKFYIAELILAVEHLHSLSIIHRDLKPENLLLDKQGHLKLTDFGLSESSASKEKKLVGTPDYVPPELINGYNSGPKGDIWSIGVILFEFLVGTPPFNASTVQEIFENILQINIPWCEIDIGESEDQLHPLAKDLISKILVGDPEKRPELKEIKRHQFFEGINLENLYYQPAPIVSQQEETSILNQEGNWPFSPYNDQINLPNQQEQHFIKQAEKLCKLHPRYDLLEDENIKQLQEIEKMMKGCKENMSQIPVFRHVDEFSNEIEEFQELLLQQEQAYDNQYIE